MIERHVAYRHEAGSSNRIDEKVAVEHIFTLECERYEHTFTCSPNHLEELVIGHLRSAGMISNREDIACLSLKEDGHKATVRLTSGAPSESNSSVPRIEMDDADLLSLHPYVTSHAPLFSTTGAFHYAFLFNNDAVAMQSACDIGRFNAIDKVIGMSMDNGIALGGAVLYTTGRIMSLTVHKALHCGIALIVSKAPPTLQAIEHAQAASIGIIGFARGDRYTAYTDVPPWNR